MYINSKIEKFIKESPNSGYNINYKHHLIFWLVYISLNILRWWGIHQDLTYTLKTNLIGFPIHMALAYFNIYYLMPKYVYTRNYFKYVSFVLIALVTMLFLKYGLTYNFVSTNVFPEGPDGPGGFTATYAITTMLGEIYVVSFVTAIKITIDWLKESSKLHALEKRQLTTELKFLRSQISPHFFFNTLNNIYSLTLEKSDKTPQVVLKLSELMRYFLYATDKRRQDLTLEIECIQNYIDLERIRFDDSLEINISITGDLENRTIAPMLLVPLIENAFKHGASKNIGKMQIDVDIKVEEEFLYFKVVNTIPENKIKSDIPTRSGGIGLSNIKKRLELGYNKEDYDLSIFEKNKLFHAILKLKV
ncbi:MAG: sensor histidine kinase [Flavobacteriaceae bacterium]|nr:MAG: sensor histidine kinase [Flavobacteriaceae bacterium]